MHTTALCTRVNESRSTCALLQYSFIRIAVCIAATLLQHSCNTAFRGRASLDIIRSHHVPCVQQTATNCNRLQQTATDYNRLQKSATLCISSQFKEQPPETSFCKTLQRQTSEQTATDCRRLQQTATGCNRLQQNTTDCNRLQHTEKRKSLFGHRHSHQFPCFSLPCQHLLQCVAVCGSVLQCVAVCCSMLQCVAVCCSVLQRVAVHQDHSPCLSFPREHPLRCVAVSCSMLQCVQCVAV